MFIYHMEIQLEDGREIGVAVVSKSDEKAFEYAENRYIQHVVKTPRIEQMVIVAKKPVKPGSGFVFA